MTIDEWNEFGLNRAITVDLKVFRQNVGLRGLVRVARIVYFTKKLKSPGFLWLLFSLKPQVGHL